jgi:site-specific recombinase XerD
VLLADITPDEVKIFLVDLGTVARAPNGIAPRPAKPLSKKTILNVHTTLSALWTWAVEDGLTDQHILRQVPRPKPEKRAINPFSEEDIRALLAACERSTSYTRPGKRKSDHARPTALRDRAIILTLVDTGIRAEELCGLTINQVDLKNRRITVMGKGSKKRVLPIGPTTAKAIWRHLAKDRHEDRTNAQLFMTRNGESFTRQTLLLLRSFGKRAGVANVHPHRFRHRFAISFLRNGGNAYALQMALGHSTMEMVKTYLAIVRRTLKQRAGRLRRWRIGNCRHYTTVQYAQPNNGGWGGWGKAIASIEFVVNLQLAKPHGLPSPR